jgi:hypothetical protein
MLMQGDNEQVRSLFPQKMEYRLHFSAFKDLARRLNAVLLRQSSCPIVQFGLDLVSVLPHSRWSGRIDDDRERCVGRKISQDRDCCERCTEGAGKIDGCAQRTLRFRQIIQGDNYLGKHSDSIKANTFIV